jgi:hypothetical protein
MIETNLIYLDTAFIVEAYESITQVDVPVTVTRTTDKSAGFSAGICSVGASTQETKEFPFNSRHMLKEIRQKLDVLPNVDLRTASRTSMPDLFWAEGQFAVGSTNTSSKGEVIHRDEFFRLYPEDEPKKGVCLLAKDIYFSAGYEQVLQHVYGAARGFAIRARVLVKTLSIQEAGFWPLCAALLIEKKEKNQAEPGDTPNPCLL